MKKVFISFIFLILSLFLQPTAIYAQKTNQFGIHILETGEVKQAAALVNSNGGDWGFVTIVLRDNDLDSDKWQKFFDQCRQWHLVPLIRLATHVENEAWAKPNHATIEQMSQFLNQLNWPVKNRYIIVFNEPNHIQEWGGEIAPEEYADILNESIEKFKAANKDFKILNAGLDLAAPNGTETQNAFNFLQKMHQNYPEIFNQLDGWASHSYPNPGFIGQVTDTGKASIQGYRWELLVLKKHFGLKKDLPVFITETGWPHAESTNAKAQKQKFYKAEKTATLIESAFNFWQNDPRIKGITPFVLHYHAPPLDTFSWFKQNGQPYPQYETVQEMKKIAWQPEQITQWEIIKSNFPKFLPLDSQYEGKIILKNIGQSIWGEKEICLEGKNQYSLNFCLGKNKKILPGESEIFLINIQAPSSGQEINLEWENLTEKAAIYLFSPGQIKSYQQDFFQKVFSLIKVWWYDKRKQYEKY